MNKPRAFTLIELLVVISIIALLMAILIPTLGLARKQAKAIVCRTRLREWGLVWAMYVDENDGKFPDYLGNDWMDKVHEYYAGVDKLLFCPMTIGRTIEEGAPVRYAVLKKDRGSYAMNEWIYDSDDTSGGRSLEDYWRSTDHSGLNNVPVMGDAAWRSDAQPNDKDEPPRYEGEPRSGKNNDEMRLFCIPRHEDGINVLFADWSTSKVGLKELWRLKWNRSFDVTAPLPVWPEWMKGFKEP